MDAKPQDAEQLASLQEKPPVGRKRAVTARAVVISLILIPLNALWIVHTEIVRYAGHPTTTSLFFNVIFCLSALIGINALLVRYRPRWVFTQGELIVIFTLLSLGSCMVGHDMYQVLIADLTHPFWYATPENKWEAQFFKHLPRWLMLQDDAQKTVLKGYFLGGTSLYHWHFIKAWIRPVLIWTGFFMVLIYIMMCLNVILRKQWSDRERLTFPIIQLPFQMTDPNFTLFKSRTMWIGFALAGVLNLINALHANIPSIPSIPLRELNLQTYLVDRPWNAIGWTPLHFVPFVIGLGFLLPTELSFSCWFFYWFWKLQQVLTSAYGWNEGKPDFPYINDQSTGAYLGVCVFALWLARNYLKEVLKKAVGLRFQVDDRDEPMSYRAAVVGVVGGFVGVVAFGIYGGMPFEIAVLFMVIYFMLAVAITRMRAELGSPAHDLHYAGPDQMISRIGGTQNIPSKALAFFSLAWGFNRAYRTHPMPHQLEGLKMAEWGDFSPRRFMWWMLVASLWGSFCAFWALLHVYYQLGAATGKIVGPSVYFGWEPYNRLSSWITLPTRPDAWAASFTVAGFLFTMFLTVMRVTFIWWPLQPVGFAVSSSWAMHLMWLSLFIAWLSKFLILRSLGLQGYRRALPFFLGLVLGEFLVGGILNIIGLVFGLQIYRFWG
ncbi:MAG: hypothetical protein IT210_00060 [Armatimonadetes bacterium]|nr:hypothetical protein [Armatimonadota bacterium]